MFRTMTFLAALLMAVPLAAQTQPAVLQPETAVVSPGGVDTVRGTYRDQSTDLSIGSEANGGITFTRVNQAYQDNKPFTSNWHIFLNKEQRRTPTPPLYNGVGYATTWELESMAVSKTWLTYDEVTFAEQGIPSPGITTFTKSQFTMADGTTIGFENGSGDAWASIMTRKDGIVYSFIYDSGGDPGDGDHRLRRVKSNTGYELILEYSGNGNDRITRACVLNSAVTAPLPANTCPPGVQTVTYTYSGTNFRLASITDALGKVWTINTSSTTPAVQSYYKPGFPATPWLVNTLGGTGAGGGTGNGVSRQLFADGRTIDYSYANLNPGLNDPFIPGLKAGRGTGWTVNSTRTTTLIWDAYQFDKDSPLFISPAPVAVIDPLGRSSGVTFEDGRFSPHSFVLSKRMIGGRSESYGYFNTGTPGGANLASRTVDPGEDPLTTSYTYNCAVTFNCAKPVTITDPKGNVSDYTYDGTNGLLRTETMPADVNGVRPQKRYLWLPKTANYKNSGGGIVYGTSVWVISSISECRTGASCANGADETLTTFAYPASNVANNILPESKTVKAGDGSLIATTTYTYDDIGNKLTEDGPLTNTADVIDISRWQYDAKRRVTHTMSPDPDGAGAGVPLAVRNTYDDAGRLTRVENGRLSNQATTWDSFAVIDSVETDHDLLDRKVQERKKDAGNVVQALTQYSYDSFGRLDCTAVRMNKAVYASPFPVSACSLGAQGPNGPDRITKNSYDAGDQLLTVTEAYGTPDQAIEATYTYTGSGKKATLTDARGYKAQMVYDGHDRQTQWRFPDKVSPGVVSANDNEVYTYDKNGNRLTLKKRDNSVLTFTYDNLNRMITKVVPERIDLPTSATRDVFMRYDLQGRQMDARFDSQSGEGLTSNYDALGRLISTTMNMDAAPRTLTYGYDIRGFRTSLTHPDSTVFDYTPDTIGRLTALKENTTTPTSLRGYSYDTNGRLIGSALGTGTPGSTTLGYDTIGRLNVLTHNIASTGADVTFGFSYSPASQTLTHSRDNDSYAWTGAVAATRNYTANGLNQYTQVVSSGTTPFTYDANGNLTSSSDASGSWTYLYDVENRLVKSTFTPTTGTAVVTNLRYDPLGRLYEVAGASTTRFLYDGDELIGEYSSAGALLRRYVHGLAVDDPVVWYEGSGTGSAALRHLIADRQGSVIGIADSNGAIIAKNTYDEYGIPKSDQAGQKVVGRFAYTGQIWLPELGMYHYKARLYSPTLGRFMQTDPIGYKDQINLYAYVGNDPISFSDSSGTCTTISTPNGSRTVGYCPRPGDTRAQEIYQQESRAFSQLEGNAVRHGWRIEVLTGSADNFGHEINGAQTNIYNGLPKAAMWIDPDDSFSFTGVDSEGNPVNYEQPMDERIIHEGGHVNSNIAGNSPGSDASNRDAISAENAYRQSKGIDVQRVDHGGSIGPRPDPPDCTGTRVCPN